MRGECQREKLKFGKQKVEIGFLGKDHGITDYGLQTTAGAVIGNQSVTAPHLSFSPRGTGAGRRRENLFVRGGLPRATLSDSLCPGLSHFAPAGLTIWPTVSDRN